RLHRQGSHWLIGASDLHPEASDLHPEKVRTTRPGLSTLSGEAVWGTYVPGDAMLLDDVFSLARRVAPRQATTWRPSLRLLPTPREKPPAESLPESEPPQSAPRARSRRRRSFRPAGVGLIERDLLCLQPTF